MRFQRKAARLAARHSMSQRGPVTAALIGALSLGATGLAANAQIDAANWGAVTAPVFGTSEAGVYAGADLFAGPNKFGDGKYYHGVLPNGKIVNPAGLSAQIGMNPLGAVLTPDGKYLITSNDDERDGGLASLQSAVNIGGYSLSVVSTSDMTVVSQINSAGPLYIGLQVKGNGPYTVYASAGASQSVKTFTITDSRRHQRGTGHHYDCAHSAQKSGLRVQLHGRGGFAGQQARPAGTTYRPSGYSTGGAKTTFPAGSALSPDGRYLYVACNGDNSLAVIDTTSNTVIKQIPVGYFPYGVSVSRDGSKVFVTNWGLTEYKFGNVTYDASGNLTAINPITTLGIPNLPDGFYVVPTSTGAGNPKTSSVSIVSVPGGNPANASLLGSIYQGQPNGLDALYSVGDTHPSATAIVRRGAQEVLYVCKANSDAIGLILVSNNRRLADFDLSPIALTLGDGHPVHGSYPNAIVVSPDNTRAYVAEAGLNSVAVLDTTVPTAPRLLGRIPTAWYPTGLTLSADGGTLYVINAKGVGEDINPKTVNVGHITPRASSRSATATTSSDRRRRSLLSSLTLDNTTVLGNNFATQNNVDTSIVPAGGAASTKIKHVFFILGENKTFDSFLGNQPHFGPFASTTFNNADGSDSKQPAVHGYRSQHPAAGADVCDGRELLLRLGRVRCGASVLYVRHGQRLYREDAPGQERARPSGQQELRGGRLPRRRLYLQQCGPQRRQFQTLWTGSRPHHRHGHGRQQPDHAQ